MILDSHVLCKISPSTIGFLKSNGCVDDRAKFHPKHNPAKFGVYVKTELLVGRSTAEVMCRCDKCEVTFTNRLSRHTDFCKKCAQSNSMVEYHKENPRSTFFGGKPFRSSGESHHRFNPNKTEFSKYAALVRQITNKQNLSILENFEKPRGVCGLAGVYQLDHIISIKTGFDSNMSPESIGSIDNLRFIPWEENREKWHK